MSGLMAMITVSLIPFGSPVSEQRPAQGVKDDLMAVAVVIEDGDRRIGIVAVDTIGLMRKFVLDVRESVPEAWQLTT